MTVDDYMMLGLSLEEAEDRAACAYDIDIEACEAAWYDIMQKNVDGTRENL